MQRDNTGTPLFKKTGHRLSEWLRVGSGEITDLGEISLSPDERTVAGAGVIMDKLEGLPGQRICLVDMKSGALKVISSGPRNDRMPRWDNEGTRIAFLSDRERPYDFQLQIYDVATSAQTSVPMEGLWVEYLQWSPDGTRLLLGAAGQGVDLAGAQGGIASPLASEAGPDWAPTLDFGAKESQWRSLWVYDPRNGLSRRISPVGINVWEAAWCGPEAVICVATDGPGEEMWYRADLRRIDLLSGEVTRLYTPADQIGWPSASPSGEHIAVVEAVCSDRTVVAGNLLLGKAGGSFHQVDTRKVDVTFTAWQGEGTLMYAGHREFDTVLAVVDSKDKGPREIWVSSERTFGGARYPEAAPARKPGRAAIVTEGFFVPPTLTIVSDNSADDIKAFGASEYVARVQSSGKAQPRRWSAPDGREIQGWLVTPNLTGPHPLVMDVHGGPVWLWRPRFVGRAGWHSVLFNEGYAIFLPNARGASGRGQEYAREVFGDMGGKDTRDYLSGLDALVSSGVADPKRIGVMGGSYGGFMSSWLITQDQRFAAAVPIAPVTNWVSEHLTCHIPHFCEMFLADEMTNPGGKYFTRSPIMYASWVKTPALNICGALDRNTPPGQALEFHHALLLHGVESVLATYPKEGHGVRSYPAVIDCCARILEWFTRHMPVRPAADGAE